MDAALCPADGTSVPALVVFDLDACCWFPEMYMMSAGSAPFSEIPGNADAKASARNETVKLLGRTRGIWAALHGSPRFEATRVAVASRCDEPAWAVELLKLFRAAPGVSFWDVLDGGALAEIYKGSKVNHFRALQKKTAIPFSDMVFFDDDMQNIRNVEALGVVCVHTPDGVTQAAWESGLDRYAKTQV